MRYEGRKWFTLGFKSTENEFILKLSLFMCTLIISTNEGVW